MGPELIDSMLALLRHGRDHQAEARAYRQHSIIPYLPLHTKSR